MPGRRKILILMLVVVILLSVVVVPAMARGKLPDGVRFNLRSGRPTTHEAGEPFHIQHGWLLRPPEDKALGKWTFALWVDGKPRQVDWKDFTANQSQEGQIELTRLWVFNFADGLPAGTHTFKGTWYAPCYEVEDDCRWPFKKVAKETFELVVTFTE